MVRQFKIKYFFVVLAVILLSQLGLRAEAQSISMANLNAGSVTLNVTSPVAGLGYFTILAGNSSVCGNSAETVLGAGSNLLQPAIRGSETLLANVASPYTVSNLAAATTYEVCFTLAGSSTVTTASFTTPSANSYQVESWSTLGASSLPTGSARSVAMAVAPDGTPYVAYADVSSTGNGAATVLENVFGQWVRVGLPQGVNTSYLSLAFAPNGVLYLSYANNAGYGYGGATVDALVAGTWVPLSSTGLSPFSAAESLAFGSDGTPYLAYVDVDNHYAVTVLKYSFLTSQWQTIATPGGSFSNPSFDYNLNFRSAANGDFYLTYEDQAGCDFLAEIDPSGNIVSDTRLFYAAWQFPALAVPPLNSALMGIPLVAYRVPASNNQLELGSQVQTTASVDQQSASVSPPTLWPLLNGSMMPSSLEPINPIAVAPDGTPYIAYSSASQPYMVQVGKVVDDIAQPVGLPISLPTLPSNYYPDSLALTMAPTGIPYLAYIDVQGHLQVYQLSGLNAGLTLSATTSSLIYGKSGTVTVSATVASGAPPAGVVSYTVNGVTSAWAALNQNGQATLALPSNLATGNHSVQVNLLPAPDSGYLPDITTVNATVNPAIPTVTSWPVASAIAAGQPLSASILSPATATVTSSGGVSTSGSFSWVSPSMVPPSGTSYYQVQFTPSDTNDFAAVTDAVSITAVTTLSASQSIHFTNLAASQVTLNLLSTAASTGYFTLLPGSATSCGTQSQVMQGVDGNGQLAIHGSLALAANVAGQTTVRNLAANTLYTVCFSPNSASPVVSASFTTTTMAGYSEPVWTSLGPLDATTSLYAGSQALAFAPDGTPYLAYADWSSAGGGAVEVMHYTNGAWQQVGAEQGQGAKSATLGFAPDGTLYLAYANQACSSSTVCTNGVATVAEYVNGSWQPVTSTGLSTASFGETLGFASDGSPYLAYIDTNDSNAAEVMTLVEANGDAEWQILGSSLGDANEALSFSVAPNGTPAITYGNTITGSTLATWDAATGQWNTASMPTQAGSESIAELVFSPESTAYVDFSQSSGSSLEVATLTQGALVSLTSTNAPTSNSSINPIAIDPTGTPYVVSSGSDGATVSSLSSGSWTTVGNPNLTDGVDSNLSLVLAPDGTPFVVFVNSSNQEQVMRLSSLNMSVVTGAATETMPASATLNGYVSNGGIAATAGFEYGTTTSYGSTVTATTPPGGSINTNTTNNVATAVQIQGLTADTLYHFRAEATVNGITTYGQDETFTTPALYTPTISITGLPSSLAYGQSGTATVTVSGMNGSPLAGSLSYSFENGTSNTVAINNSGSASINLAADFPPNSYTVDGTFTPSDQNDYAAVPVTLNITVVKATPTVSAWPSVTGNAVYGEALSSVSLGAGTGSTPGSFNWSNPAQTVGSGTQQYSVTFTPTDATDYASVKNAISVTATKATPTVTKWPVVTGTIFYGQSLSAVSLSAGTAAVPGTFQWANPVLVPGAGAGTYPLQFIPTDTEDYSSLTQPISLTVEKAPLTVSAAPVASGLTYGESLSDSTLTGGNVTDANGKIIAGEWSWASPSASPSQIGANTESAVFTPADSADYGTVTASVQVVQTMAMTSITALPTAANISYGEPLSASALTGGKGSIAGSFVWTNPQTVPTGVGTTQYSVTFEPTDATHYAATTSMVSLVVTRATPTVKQWPTVSDLAFNQPLSSAVLTEGEVVGANGEALAGSFSWQDGAVLPGAPGNYQELMVFTPKDAVNYSPITQTVSVTVVKAVLAVSLTANVDAAMSQTPVTFTASFHAPAGGVPTGTVAFLNGITILGSAALENGVASLTTSALPVGNDSITAIYAGDENFAAQTTPTIMIQIRSFAWSLNTGESSTDSISAGGMAHFNLMITPVGGSTFPYAVQFSVTGLPAGATASFTPDALAAGSAAQQVTMTVTMPQNVALLHSGVIGSRIAGGLSLALLFLPWGASLRRKGQKLSRIAMVLLVLSVGMAGVVSLTGCGVPNKNAVKAMHSYNLTVTASSKNFNTSTTVTMNVLE